MKKTLNVLILTILVLAGFSPKSMAINTGEAKVSGELKKWHKVTISFGGPSVSETDASNPFLNYRLDVTFTNGSKSFVVPGYFAADGNAAETSAESGNVWRVHFAPDEIGTWTYTASFKTGNNIAVADNANGGSAVSSIHGKTGTFNISPSDKTGRDNRSRGCLKYVNERYLKWPETGRPFIKAGADSPENFLAYEDFDNTPNAGGRRKSWAPHQKDYRAGDPTWKNGKGSEIIGAINYLASEGLNVFSFLTMNINGDDKNVFPYIADNKRTQFDCSKLDQWEIVFDYADRNGFYLHFKTQETENEQLLDGGNVGVERKVYYRELIARFGHHLALNWNMGEENGEMGAVNQNDEQRRQMAQYFWDNDPYRHLVVIHSPPGTQESLYRPLLGDKSKYTGISIQKGWWTIHAETAKWVKESEAAGKPWVVANDEQNSPQIGVPHDSYTGDQDKHDIRQKTLWGNLMAGGGGVEYYFGSKTQGTDLDCQDYRTRDQSWDYCRYALEFLSSKPLDKMTPNDNLASGNNNWCLADEGREYIVFLSEGGTSSLNITKDGTYDVRWYDPRNGGSLQSGSVTTISGTGNKALGNAPNNGNQDWVVYIKNNDGNSYPVPVIESAVNNSDPKSFSFSGAKSTDANGTIVSYKWNFGDGQTATGANVTHTYAKGGTYTVELTVVDNGGASSTATESVTAVVAVTGISLGSPITIDQGETETIEVIFEPADASNRQISWKSADESIVTISEAGAIKGIGVGTTTITATSADGGHKATVDVKVNPSTSFTLSPIHDAYLQGTSPFNSADLRVEAGKRTTYLMFDLSAISGDITSAQLTLGVGSDGGSGDVAINLGTSNNWTETTISTSNAPAKGAELGKIASGTYAVGKTYNWDLDGALITGGGMLSLVVEHLLGNDVSFASKENGSSALHPVLTVKLAGEAFVPITGLSISSSEASMSSGGCIQFDAIVEPGNATATDLVWEVVGDDGIISVNQSGYVCAESSGVVELVVSTKDKMYSAKATITVDNATDVKDNVLDGFLIYPNPLQDNLHIVSDVEIKQVKIYNTCGRLVKAEVGNSDVFSVSTVDLPKGLYVVKLEIENNRIITKKVSKL